MITFENQGPSVEEEWTPQRIKGGQEEDAKPRHQNTDELRAGTKATCVSKTPDQSLKLIVDTLH